MTLTELKPASGQETANDAPASTVATARPRRVLYMDHTAALGGGEIALLHLVSNLDRSRFTPIVVLFSDGPLRQGLRDAGIENHVLPLDAGIVETAKDKLGIKSLLQFGRLKSIAIFVHRVRRFIAEIDADIVHTNSLKSDLLGGLAARWARVPLVWHVRDRIASDYLPAKVAAVFRIASRWIPNYVIAVSRGVMLTLLPPGTTVIPQNMRVVYDGTPDLHELPASHDDLPPADHRPLIAIVGRISRWKGQHIFIRAAQRVLAHYPRARFQIVGSAMFGQDAYEQEIRSLAKELGISDMIEFTGFRSDVKDVIGQLDVLVHASILGEPFGLVVIEGMAQGKPVVCTNGGGMPEVIEDGVTGLLVPMGDDAALAKAIETFLADPVAARRFGRKGWERVRDRFTIGHVCAGVQEVYDLIPVRAK